MFAPWALVFTASTPLSAETIIPSPYWRNAITLPGDAFRAQEYGAEDPGWIKFTIFKSDPTQVYFQDSRHFPFHYEFAHELVQEYQGFTHEQFDQYTLYPDSQLAVLGAVIMPHWVTGMPPEIGCHEYGIQFVGKERYDPAFVVTLFELVRSGVTAPAGTRVFYFPTFEQQAVAEENQAYFESQGIIIGSTARWSTQNVVYAPGWALGALKFVTGAQITPAYQSGQLLPGDILLTDGVPAEVPMVAGIISLVPSTPNSHVAILSKTFGNPFAYLASAKDVSRAQELVGHRVALRVTTTSWKPAEVQLMDAEGLTPQQVDELLEMRTPPPLEISPVAPYGAFSASADGLNPVDVRYFGGKAAHFGMIRRSIPANSPVATAFSFDLWTAFMAQTMPDRRTLGQTIQDRLGGYTYPPVSMAALSADLDAVRDMIKDDTTFSPELQAAVMATLQDSQYDFHPDCNIRFRSSTNVEDTEQFSGAGMYDSFSGCLADDLDGDAYGPSICDPTEPKERGVFRAIRKVYASFYNENAYLERLRHGVNEDAVGMGLLVHHSYPDEYELANGVVTYSNPDPMFRDRAFRLVTQQGAISVTNPPPGSVPEEVLAYYTNLYGPYFAVETHSNLVPLGGTVLEWQSEYRQLVTLLESVVNEFVRTTGRSKCVLNFEYKKLAPDGRLEIKQVRELASPDTTADTIPFMVGEPIEYCTCGGGLFANHRLKMRWNLRTRNLWLTPAELQSSIYADGVLAYVHEGEVRELIGAPPSWPAYTHTYANGASTDAWSVEGLENPTRYSLTTNDLGELVSDADTPLRLITDLNGGYLHLRADYAKPVPIVPTWDGTGLVLSDFASFSSCLRPSPTDRLQQRWFTVGRITINTRFYWPAFPTGIVAAYTAPLVRWDSTTITGLTQQPLVLRGWYSQTYSAETHNVNERFLFEPELEEGLPPDQREELRAKNIWLIYAFLGDPLTIKTYAFPSPGDFNYDGHVDSTDLEHFQNCRSGADVDQTSANCRDADLDLDLDVDQSDFGFFQRCLSGTGRADPTCMGQ